MMRRLLSALAVAALQTPGVAWAVASVEPRVIGSLPHDSAAFTQGLLLYDGYFFESTGLYGRSSLRRVEPSTGEVIESVGLAADEFGEGLARVDQRLIQLTWQENVAHVYDLESFAVTESIEYSGEGWGLCFDGRRLVMSDGSDRLFFRDPLSFAELGSQAVVRDGQPVLRLNELECVNGLVYANVWMTDSIVVIDPASGQVLAEVDASGLLTAAEAESADVLNGIAFDDAEQHFFLTGKLWPKVFEVEIDWGRGSGAPIESARGGSCSLLFVGVPGTRRAFWCVVGVLGLAGYRRRFCQPLR